MKLAPASRYPADPRAVFILAFSVFIGLTALVLEVAPGSLESVLPHWAVFVWGALLAGGSLITLTGMALQTVNGVLIEQVGSMMVGVTTLYYAIIGIAYAGPAAIQVVGIVFAWGVACIIRYFQLLALVRHGQAEALAAAAERALGQ